MRNRFFVERAEGERIELTGEEFHHASRVLRCKVGEEVEVFDSEGRLFHGAIAALERDRAVVDLVREEAPRESPLAIDLAIALIQPEKFELVLQKGCELGVRTFVPLVTERIETRPERVAGKRGRWEKILIEATKQSGRSAIPRITEPQSLSDVLSSGSPSFFFDADAVPSTPPEAVASATILVGPEGGWTPEEIEAARDGGAWICRLGPRRLRAETAALAAVTLIAARYGDLR